MSKREPESFFSTRDLIFTIATTSYNFVLEDFCRFSEWVFLTCFFTIKTRAITKSGSKFASLTTYSSKRICSFSVEKSLDFVMSVGWIFYERLRWVNIHNFYISIFSQIFQLLYELHHERYDTRHESDSENRDDANKRNSWDKLISDPYEYQSDHKRKESESDKS